MRCDAMMRRRRHSACACVRARRQQSHRPAIMFWDLSVIYPPGGVAQARLIAAQAIQLGYDGIVWTRVVSSKLSARDSNTMQLPEMADVWQTTGSQQALMRLKAPDYDVPPTAASAAAAAAAAAAAGSAAASSASAIATAASSSAPSAAAALLSHSFQQRTRLHLVIEDQGQLHSLNPTNAVLQSYDLISVASSNEKLFHACCSHESVDIVTIEGSRKLPFYLKKPAINLALERGIHFEFNYGPAIRDAASRRYLFSNVLSFLRLTKGRNMILTSAATREMELRAPWDVINLGVLCGIDASTSKASISSYARSVLLHAAARRTVKCVLTEVRLLTPGPPTAAPEQHAHATHPKPTHAKEDQQQKKKARHQ